MVNISTEDLVCEFANLKSIYIKCNNCTIYLGDHSNFINFNRKTWLVNSNRLNRNLTFIIVDNDVYCDCYEHIGKKVNESFFKIFKNKVHVFY